jgi:hypothetical protein
MGTYQTLPRSKQGFLVDPLSVSASMRKKKNNYKTFTNAF